ncbi:DUF4755 domain-containing protein [Citrobacter sp. Cpo137]|uniref:DUF4755 domain-containing protein n=1 Tax=Enterobacterales TaxID=91347 RepID=UPI00155D9C9D|nr:MULTISPECIES: DUF4755 domain-containing protein [Enterobacterales]MDM2780792.1 DUF4755 domain-containing protein [Citrobacter sp. Cpo137]UIX51307.1 hypothetical protein [Providencia rettgeri]
MNGNTIIKWLKILFGISFLMSGFPMLFGTGFSAFPFVLVGVVLLFSAYQSSKKETATKTYVKYLNENNDGIYTYYTKFGKDEYGVHIDTNKRTIDLKSGKMSRTVGFDSVKSWSYKVDGISKVNFINGTSSVMNNASGQLQALALNNKAGASAWDNNGLFIHTDELSNPVWHIKIIPENAKFNFKSDKFWKDVANECQVWMNVMERAVK